jgi:ribosomal protein S18 acetylase RimI-like enzyme
MQDFKLISYQREYAGSVRTLALKAWNYTYKNIFSGEEIKHYVNTFYSEENSKRAEELMEQKVLYYSLAISADGELIGFQTSSIQMLHAELTRIYVLPEKIGSGVGSALLKDAENFFLRNGFNSYQVKVHKYNTLGQKFYERRGFEMIGEDEHDHLILKKSLI